MDQSATTPEYHFKPIDEGSLAHGRGARTVIVLSTERISNFNQLIADAIRERAFHTGGASGAVKIFIVRLPNSRRFMSYDAGQLRESFGAKST